VVAATRRYVEGLLVTFAWAIVCLVWLRPSAQPLDGIGTGFPGESLTYEDRGFVRRGTAQPWFDGPGVYLASGFGYTASHTGFSTGDPDEVVVVVDGIGAFGYAVGTDVRILDVHGLAEPLTAHQRLAFRSVPGHEKLASGPWLVAMLAADPANVPPDAIVQEGWWVPDPQPLDYLHEVAWARAVLACDAVEQLVEAPREPFGFGRFVSNVMRSVSTTNLRVDRSARQAYLQLCGNDIPSEVSEFYDRAILGERLPSRSEPGDVALAGDCRAVFLGTGDRTEPWRPIEAATLGASITMDPEDPQPGLAAVFAVGPYGTSTAVVWVETDGQGNYRLRQDIDWFPPSFQPWSVIPDGGVVNVTVSPDTAVGQWYVSAPVVLPGLPMAADDAETPEEDGTTVVVPRTVGRSASAGSIDVDYAEFVPGGTCQAILDHHNQREG
jgi:hypothetical protein